MFILHAPGLRHLLRVNQMNYPRPLKELNYREFRNMYDRLFKSFWWLLHFLTNLTNSWKNAKWRMDLKFVLIESIFLLFLLLFPYIRGSVAESRIRSFTLDIKMVLTKGLCWKFCRICILSPCDVGPYIYGLQKKFYSWIWKYSVC